VGPMEEVIEKAEAMAKEVEWIFPTAVVCAEVVNGGGRAEC